MDSSPTVPDAQTDRAEASAADATIGQPLGAAAKTSLPRALKRLPEAVVLSDDEAQITKRTARFEYQNTLF